MDSSQACGELSLEECPCSTSCLYLQLRQSWTQKFKKSITLIFLADEATRKEEQAKLRIVMDGLKKEIDLLERELGIPPFLLFVED